MQITDTNIGKEMHFDDNLFKTSCKESLHREPGKGQNNIDSQVRLLSKHTMRSSQHRELGMRAGTLV